MLDNRKPLVPAQVVWRGHQTVGIIFPRGQFMAELKRDANVSLAMVQSRREGTPLH